MNYYLLIAERRRLLDEKEWMNEQKFIGHSAIMLILVVLLLPVLAYYLEASERSLLPALLGLAMSLCLLPAFSAKHKGEDELDERLKALEEEIKALEEKE